jgi:hypothetical protein
VYEDILARFSLNKAIALRIIEPFYGSFLLHASFISFLKFSSPVSVTIPKTKRLQAKDFVALLPCNKLQKPDQVYLTITN